MFVNVIDTLLSFPIIAFGEFDSLINVAIMCFHYDSNQAHKSCNFAGAIPNEIGNLTMLTILDFAVNKLSGMPNL